MEIDFGALAAPFQIDDIEFRAGSTNGDKTKALALVYITSRAVMNRLDDIAGPANWCDVYSAGPDGGVVCGLSLRVNGEWITKWDGAENTNYEAVKGGLSDALKRAAVKWGIGRYLYNSPNVWIPCQQRGKTVIIDQRVARDAYIKAGGEWASNKSQSTPSPITPTDLHAPVDPPPGRPKNGKTVYGSPQKLVDLCNKKIGGEPYYNIPHLKNTIGGDWPDWTDAEAVKQVAHEAVDYGKQRRAEQEATPDVVDEIDFQ